MIEIIQHRNLFDNNTLSKLTSFNLLKKEIFLIDLDLISEILSYDLPLKDYKKSVNHLLLFISHIDNSQKDNLNTLRIHHSVFIDYFTRSLYKKYIEILIKCKYLTPIKYDDGWYKCDEASRQFRVNTYDPENVCMVLIEKPIKLIEVNNHIKKLDIRYINTIKKLDINIPEAIKDELYYHQNNNTDIQSLVSRIKSIFYTRHKRFIKKGNKVDRIYHSFTNISRVSRKHFTIKFIDIDITNCQPLLLVAYLKKNTMNVDLNYQNDCEFGMLYERFYDINKKLIGDQLRNEIKVSIYRDIFFSFNKNSKYNLKFKELYPLTWNNLNTINDSDVSLASLLQNIESELFNNLKPIKSKYYYTLFDAIYFTDMDDIEQIENEIKHFFQNLGIKVAIKKSII